MTQDEKELVIKDLSGRLPYGVIVQVNDGLRGIYDRRLAQVFCDRVSCSVNVCDPLKECICIDSVKPYLRPLSSMTEEEKKEYGKVCELDTEILANHPMNGEPFPALYNSQDWLNKNMFDYRGLIPRGLALETTEGMNEHEAKSDVNESGLRIGIGCKIRSKTNPDVILSIVSDDCHEDKFECSNGSVLSLKQIKKHYDLYIEENKRTIVIN